MRTDRKEGSPSMTGEVYLKVLKAAIGILAIIIIAIIVYVDSSGNVSDEAIRVGDERVNIYSTNGEDYLFLPSYADAELVTDKYETDSLTVMQSANIPAIFIDTRSGSLENIYADKEYSESGRMRIINSDGSEDYNGSIRSVSGRGNYSWNNWDKKSFTIKTGSEKRLLNLPTGGAYILLANASDASFIRNELGRRFEAEAAIDYVPLGEFVDLYINGDYQGNYYICPSMTIGEERINIHNLEKDMDRIYKKTNYEAFKVYETPTIKGWNLKDNPEDYTGGYLLEQEFMDRYKAEYGRNKSGFETDNEECFVVDSPKYCSKKEINYIANLMQETEAAILSGDGINHKTGKSIDEYIDIESFAKWYIVGELCKNYDAGISSAYFYKDSDLIDGRFKMSSGWDYDMSLGNYLDWMEYYGQSGEGLTKLHSTGSASLWTTYLYENEDFRNHAIKIYRDSLLPYAKWLLDSGIDEYEDRLQASARMDSVRWADMYEADGCKPGPECYDRLNVFISERIDFLNEIWNIE